MNTSNLKKEVEWLWLVSEKALVVLNQVLNNKGLERHGGVVGSVYARLVIGQTHSCFHVYKITNTRRLGLYS